MYMCVYIYIYICGTRPIFKPSVYSCTTVPGPFFQAKAGAGTTSSLLYSAELPHTVCVAKPAVYIENLDIYSSHTKLTTVTLYLLRRQRQRRAQPPLCCTQRSCREPCLSRAATGPSFQNSSERPGSWHL